MKIENLKRYLYGMMMGVIVEYLLLDEFNILLFVILCLLLTVTVNDIFNTKKQT